MSCACIHACIIRTSFSSLKLSSVSNSCKTAILSNCASESIGSFANKTAYVGLTGLVPTDCQYRSLQCKAPVWQVLHLPCCMAIGSTVVIVVPHHCPIGFLRLASQFAGLMGWSEVCKTRCMTFSIGYSLHVTTYLKWRCKYGYICDCDTWHMDLYTRVVEQRCVATVLFADMCV